jgi:hypothetical protein
MHGSSSIIEIMGGFDLGLEHVSMVHLLLIHGAKLSDVL